jgi:hypothetical protein
MVVVVVQVVQGVKGVRGAGAREAGAGVREAGAGVRGAGVREAGAGVREAGAGVRGAVDAGEGEYEEKRQQGTGQPPVECARGQAKARTASDVGTGREMRSAEAGAEGVAWGEGAVREELQPGGLRRVHRRRRAKRPFPTRQR